ncbi:uncharacterized protein LOC111598137 [Drosophila hydei]|uniref:Uncharacterized protein LOC111598137 n=1 Tax=Drosophila hydei TaxID=7224 RepID=A0A6J1LRS6_DROHY|nr:uncharacterized protein LOC111598137 [Drosophila hydei]
MLQLKQSSKQSKMRARAFIIILSIWCCCSGASATRLRRQVVQPQWLMRPDLLPSAQATKVKVTPQNLQEVAALRAAILRAVNDGTYAVDASSKQFVPGVSQTSKPRATAAPLKRPVQPAFPSWWQPG